MRKINEIIVHCTATFSEQKVTIDDLRKKLAAMAGNGHKAAVKKLLEKYGSTKISGVDPKDYGNLMRDALEVENAK